MGAAQQGQKAAEQVDREVSTQEEREDLVRGLDEDSPDTADAKRTVQATTDADRDIEEMTG